MAHPAGETNDGVLRLDFDRRLMLQLTINEVFTPSKKSSGYPSCKPAWTFPFP
jgi:hypothetical protein